MSAITDNEEGYLIANEIGDTRMREHYMFSIMPFCTAPMPSPAFLKNHFGNETFRTKFMVDFRFTSVRKSKICSAISGWWSIRKTTKHLKRIINYPARGIGQNKPYQTRTVCSAEQSLHLGICNKHSTFAQRIQQRNSRQNQTNFTRLIEVFREKLETHNAFELASELLPVSEIMKDLYKDQTPERGQSIRKYSGIAQWYSGVFYFSTRRRNPRPTEQLHGRCGALDRSGQRQTGKTTTGWQWWPSIRPKDLNLKNVFIVGVEENLFPSKPKRTKNVRRFWGRASVILCRINSCEQHAYLSYCPSAL